jgi:hypothetical protein
MEAFPMLFYSKKLKKMSLAGNVVNKKRAALSPSSVNNLVCLSNWL